MMSAIGSVISVKSCPSRAANFSLIELEDDIVLTGRLGPFAPGLQQASKAAAFVAKPRPGAAVSSQ